MARATEKFNISNRAGVSIANAVMKDLGIITDENDKLVVDKRKLQRERDKIRLEIQAEEQSHFTNVNSIYLDGRKDATLKVEAQSCRKVLEEHIVLVGEPGDFYLTHLSPENGRGETIANYVFNAINNTELHEKLKIIGTDDTASMTAPILGL